MPDVKFKDYYQRLGVSRDASQDEIKRAYRKLARKYHPDVSKEADAETRFKEVSEAYEVLKDPEKRAAYDQIGSRYKEGQDFRPPPDWKTEFDFGGGEFTGADSSMFSDFFDSLFGGSFGGRRSQPDGGGFWSSRGAGRQPQMRGEDVRATIRLGLEDAFKGVTSTLTLQMPEYDQQGQARMETKKVKVRIPPGATEGRQIRLPGQGSPGIGGGPNGDLYLEVHLEPHPFFRPEGSDISLTLPIAPWEAALGATVKVPTLGGPVELKIPKGANSGQKLRLKGRGLPGKRKGDQYVVLQIVVPEPQNEEQEKLYRDLAKEMPFNPRAGMGV